MPTPIVAAAPSLWSNIKALFGCAQVAIGTATIIVSAIDDMAVAAQAQTSIIRDTSLNDVAIKRIDLDDRIAARKAQQVADKATATAE